MENHDSEAIVWGNYWDWEYWHFSPPQLGGHSSQNSMHEKLVHKFFIIKIYYFLCWMLCTVVPYLSSSRKKYFGDILLQMDAVGIFRSCILNHALRTWGSETIKSPWSSSTTECRDIYVHIVPDSAQTPRKSAHNPLSPNPSLHCLKRKYLKGDVSKE